MKTEEEIYSELKEAFPDAVQEFINVPFEPHITVSPLEIHNVCRYLYNTEGLEFTSLVVLSGVDDANGEKTKDEAGSLKITGGTLSVYYHLFSMPLGHKLTLKVSTDRENPEVESVEPIWRAADWQEREVFDLLGIKFLNHPDLQRILMPYDWPEDSFPLRKDFQVPEFYNGMKIPY